MKLIDRLRKFAEIHNVKFVEGTETEAIVKVMASREKEFGVGTCACSISPRGGRMIAMRCPCVQMFDAVDNKNACHCGIFKARV